MQNADRESRWKVCRTALHLYLFWLPLIAAVWIAAYVYSYLRLENFNSISICHRGSLTKTSAFHFQGLFGGICRPNLKLWMDSWGKSIQIDLETVDGFDNGFWVGLVVVLWLLGLINELSILVYFPQFHQDLNTTYRVCQHRSYCIVPVPANQEEQCNMNRHEETRFSWHHNKNHPFSENRKTTKNCDIEPDGMKNIRRHHRISTHHLFNKILCFALSLIQEKFLWSEHAHLWEIIPYLRGPVLLLQLLCFARCSEATFAPSGKSDGFYLSLDKQEKVRGSGLFYEASFHRNESTRVFIRTRECPKVPGSRGPVWCRGGHCWCLDYSYMHPCILVRFTAGTISWLLLPARCSVMLYENRSWFFLTQIAILDQCCFDSWLGDFDKPQARIQDFGQGGQRSFDTKGALSKKFAQNRGFSLKIAWKLHDLKNLGAREGPPGSATDPSGIWTGRSFSGVDNKRVEKSCERIKNHITKEQMEFPDNHPWFTALLIRVEKFSAGFRTDANKRKHFRAHATLSFFMIWHTLSHKEGTRITAKEFFTEKWNGSLSWGKPEILILLMKSFLGMGLRCLPWCGLLVPVVHQHQPLSILSWPFFGHLVKGPWTQDAAALTHWGGGRSRKVQNPKCDK